MPAPPRPEVYEAHTAERMGSVTALRVLFRTLRTYWPQVRLNIVDSCLATYRGAYLSRLWAVLMPVVPMSVFMVIAALGILGRDVEYPAGVYIAAGLTIWMLFAETITISINGVRGLSHSIEAAQTPLLVPVVSKYGQLFSDTLIRLLALVAWLLAAGIPFRWTMLTFPLLFLPVVAFSMGIGLILAVFNIVLPDVDQLTGMILRYAVFFSYAIFPLPSVPWVRAMDAVNLPAIYIVNIREILVRGTCPQPVAFAVACGIGLLVFVLGVRTFLRLEPRIIERL